jgi:hypothetical protein
VPEISCKGEATPARVFLILDLEQFPGTVTGTIVHTDNLAIHAPRPGNRTKACKEFGQYGFFIEAWDDDGYFFHAGFVGHRS